MTQDFRYGWRQLKRTPTFTLTAILSLGLGMGASVTMFSAFRAVFLRALPYRDANRIVALEKIASQGYTPASTVADLDFLKRHAHSFTSSAWHGFFKSGTLSGVDEPVDLWVRDVSAELFPFLGVQPLLGRTLVAADFQPAARPSAVLAYETWQKYFHGNPKLIGRSIFLNKQEFAVVGVMPRNFSFPRAGIAVWLPDRQPATDPLKTYISIVARLAPDVSVESAQTELNQLTPALLRGYPEAQRNFRLQVQQMATLGVNDYRKAFLLLLGATGFLVVLACLNIASLLLARAFARQNEFSLRAALGAGRARLIRQVLAESLVLAALSGTLGVSLAWVGNRLLLWLLPAHRLEIPRLEETGLDLEVLGFAVLLTFSAALLFGVAPAFTVSGTHQGKLDQQSRTSRNHTWRLHVLLIAEASLALMLFAGSILMIRSFVRLANVSPGFRTAHILTAAVPPGHATRLTREQLMQRYRELLQVARNSPGVENAALTSYLPLGRIRVQLQVHLPGLSPNPYQLDFHAVSADYFSVMGIPLLQGRAFDPAQPKNDKGAVLINQAMARRYWPGQNAIGQRLSGSAPPAPADLTVVGIVGDTQHGTLSGEPVPEFYENYQQYLGPAVGTTLVLRVRGDPRQAAQSVRQAIHRFDPDQVIENEQTLQTTVEQSMATPRFYTALMTTFGVIALGLTLVGVYGVASYGVSLRKREFGIRLALGAIPAQLVCGIVRQGLILAGMGIAAGGLGAWGLAHLMSGLVYGIPVRDPASLEIAGAVLLAGALAAYYVPARRSTKIDPAVVLRQE